MIYDRAAWSQHYDGHDFRALSEAERGLLAQHAPTTDSAHALDIGCGTGELAAHLASHGYDVDALVRARAKHGHVDGVRWLALDIEHDDPAVLRDDGYDLITMRLMFPFLGDRTRVLRALAGRLRPGGALIVITPLASRTAPDRRRIALDDEEIAQLTSGWEHAQQYAADDLAFIVMRGPQNSYEAVEKDRRPQPQAVLGSCAVVTNEADRVLLGRTPDGIWELPGGRVESGESVSAAAVRELAEETGLHAPPDAAHLVTILHDDRADVRRISAVVRITAWTGAPEVREPHRVTRWEWHDLHALAGPSFAPSAHALEAVWPGVLPDLPAVYSYPHACEPPAVEGELAEAARLRIHSPTVEHYAASSSATREMQQEQVSNISRLTPQAAESRSEQIARGLIESGQEPAFLLESANFQDDYTLVCADRYWRMRIEASPTCETAALCARWLYTHTGNLTPTQIETIEEQWSLGLGFIASSCVQSPDEVKHALHSNRNTNRETLFSALFHAGKLRANYRFSELRAHMKGFRSENADTGLTDRTIVLALQAFASLGGDAKPDAGLHMLRWAWENRSTRTTADVCLNSLGAARPFPEQGHLLRAYAKEIVSEQPADHAAHYWLASGHHYAHDHANALDSIDKALALLPARGARGSHALMREQHLSLRQRISQALRQTS